MKQLDIRKVVETHTFFMRMSPNIKARIIKLNPVLTEGQIVRGYFHKPTSWRRVKKWLLRNADISVMGARWYTIRVPGGEIVHSYLHYIDLNYAKERGWIK